MKKTNRSEASLMVEKSTTRYKEVYEPPLDVIVFNIHHLRVPDETPKPYAIVATFAEQLIISSVIMSTDDDREVVDDGKNMSAVSQMTYDPSDYEKMCHFADNPLIIKLRPVANEEKAPNCSRGTSVQINQSFDLSQKIKSSSVGTPERDSDTYCCNIDILPIFMDINTLCFKKRLELYKPSVLFVKSWDNLPIVTITLKAVRNPANAQHHEMLKNANYMKATLIGSYNMVIPFEDQYVYTAASKLPLNNQIGAGVFVFNNGYRLPQRFNNNSFYPHWESTRLGNKPFTSGDDKFVNILNDIYNEEKIDVNYYVNEIPEHFTTLWASFHRVLMLKSTEELLAKQIRKYKWPLEVHIYGDNRSYSFMGFVDLLHLLYPGETSTRVVVPLQWIDAQIMMDKCGCQLLLTPNDNVPSIIPAVQKTNKPTADSAHTSTVTELTYVPRPTGSDENCSFVIIEFALAKPFKEPVIPPHIPELELNEMLIKMEGVPTKRDSAGRGQLERDWRASVRSAANALRRVPYFGLTDLCTMSRQLSESRTRLELMTSFCQDAAVYVNNNFVIKDFLHAGDTIEEMLTVAHACLVRVANDTLQATNDIRQVASPELRAARHARHLQDLPHAVDLYLQLVVDKPREANIWRELATCLKDVDSDLADICINKAIIFNPRHPLSLLAKGCSIFEVDPDAAEHFFIALIALYPFYTNLCVVASAYYLHRELFDMAQEIMEQIKITEAEGLSQEMLFPRMWERELGDWWDHTPLMRGTNRYYEAADLLLRIRAVSLAEICIAWALSENGECAVYYHMVALCCRIRGNIGDALCHIKQGIEKYGEISYLRSLEGECFHKQKELNSSMASFEKINCSGSPYIALLSLPRNDHVRVKSILTDVTRRHPNAYAWMAFAEYWIMCGENKMFSEKWSQHNVDAQQSFCFRIAKALRECRCQMCEHLSV